MKENNGVTGVTVAPAGLGSEKSVELTYPLKQGDGSDLQAILAVELSERPRVPPRNNINGSWKMPAVLLTILFVMGILVTCVPSGRNQSLTVLTPEQEDMLDSGSISFVTIAAGMVLLMTPSLSFFYGGMVRSKNMISTLLTSFTIMGVIGLLWTIIGFSLAFGENEWGGLIGNPSTYFFLRNVGFQPATDLGADEIPRILYCTFQAAFAMLTPAIIMGAVAERANFNSMLWFAMIWHLVVYCPLAHCQWHPNGLLQRFGHLDYAGGTVVHMSSGVTALFLAHMMGERSMTEHHHSPAHLPYVLLGTALLWFGWHGFNGGSAYSADPIAVYAIYNTDTAAAAGAAAWVLWDKANGRKVSLMGACCGTVVGMVVITPGCGYVDIGAAFISGMVGSIASNIASGWMKDKAVVDDTLDVFAVHGVGGFAGMILLAFFADNQVSDVVASEGLEGVFYGSGKLLWHTLIVTCLISLYCGVATFVIYHIVNPFCPFRASEEAEALGMDAVSHGEVVVMGSTRHIPAQQNLSRPASTVSRRASTRSQNAQASTRSLGSTAEEPPSHTTINAPSDSVV